MKLHIILIITIIICLGGLGGIINYYLVIKESDQSRKFLLAKSILLGIGASILVPLFLETISSNITDFSECYPVKNYFIFAGFCLIAAIFSKRFIEDLYSRIGKVEEEAKAAKEIANDLEDSKSEIDNLDQLIFDSESMKSNVEYNSLQNDIEPVVNAIIKSKFTYRTVTGISKDSGFDIPKVERILELLYDSGLAVKKLNRNGNTIWRLKTK